MAATRLPADFTSSAVMGSQAQAPVMMEVEPVDIIGAVADKHKGRKKWSYRVIFRNLPDEQPQEFSARQLADTYGSNVEQMADEAAGVLHPDAVQKLKEAAPATSGLHHLAQQAQTSTRAGGVAQHQPGEPPQAQEDAAAPSSGPTSAGAFACAMQTQALQLSEDQAAAARELPAHLQQAPAQLSCRGPASGPGGYGAGAAASNWPWTGSQQQCNIVRRQAEPMAGPFTQQPSQYSQVDEGYAGGQAGQQPSPAAAAAAAARDHASNIQLSRQGYGVLPPAATRGTGGMTATQHSSATPSANAAALAAHQGTGVHPTIMPANAAGMEADDLAASLMMPQVTQWSPPKRHGLQAVQAAPPAGVPSPGGQQRGPQQPAMPQPGQARGPQQQSPPTRIQGEQLPASSWPAQASPGRGPAAQQKPVGRHSFAQQDPHNAAPRAAPQPQQEQPRWVDFREQESGLRSSGLRPAGPEPARQQAGSSRPASPQPWAAGSNQRGGVTLPVWAGSGRSDSPPWASQLQAGPLPGASTWQGVQQQTSTGAQLQATGVPHVPAEVQVTETTGTRGAQPPAAGAAELQGNGAVDHRKSPRRQAVHQDAGAIAPSRASSAQQPPLRATDGLQGLAAASAVAAAGTPQAAAGPAQGPAGPQRPAGAPASLHVHFENSLREAGLGSVELLASAGLAPPVAAPTCSAASGQQAANLDVQDGVARSAMGKRQAVPLSPQEGQGGATAGQGQQAAAAASAVELTGHASVSPVRKRARHAPAAAGEAAAEATAAVHAAAAARGLQRQQPTQAESLSAAGGNHLQGVQQLASGDGRSQSRSPVASQSLHSHFQSRLQAAGLDSVDLLQLARHHEATMSVGPPARAPPAAPLQPARGGGLRLLVPQFKAEAARLARGSLPVARPAADVTRAQPPGRKAPARPAQQAGISAEYSRGDRQQQQPAAEQAQTAGVEEPAQASSHPSGRAAADAEAPQPEQVSARHAGGKGGPEEPQQPQRSSRKRARDGQGSLAPAAADTVKPEQPSDAESDEVQVIQGTVHSLSAEEQELERRLGPEGWQDCTIRGARKAKDAEDEESMVVQLVWSDGHRQWLPTSKLQQYHHCCKSLVAFYESRARSRPVPKSNA